MFLFSDKNKKPNVKFKNIILINSVHHVIKGYKVKESVKPTIIRNEKILLKLKLIKEFSKKIFDKLNKINSNFGQ